MNAHPSPVEVRALWDFDDPADSERRFREAADRRPSEVWTTQIARALGLQDRCREAIALLDTIGDADPTVLAWTLLERGRAVRSDGDAEAAAPLFRQATQVAGAVGLEFVVVDALHMLALTAAPADAVAAHTSALRAARSASDPFARTWECSILTNIGMTHADRGDWAAALAAFEEARTAAANLTDAAERLLVADWMVAWALRHLGRSAEALELQRDLKRRLDVLGRVDPYVDEELDLLAADQTFS